MRGGAELPTVLRVGHYHIFVYCDRGGYGTRKTVASVVAKVCKLEGLFAAAGDAAPLFLALSAPGAPNQASQCCLQGTSAPHCGAQYQLALTCSLAFMRRACLSRHEGRKSDNVQTIMVWHKYVFREMFIEICRTLEKREIHAKFAAGEKVTQVLL